MRDEGLGVLLVFQTLGTRTSSDEEMFRSEIRLGARWPRRSAMTRSGRSSTTSTTTRCVPTPPQALSYLAGRTSSITLGTGAVILPWNDPLRVAEKITLLDHLAERPVGVRDGPGPGEDGVHGLPAGHERGPGTLRRGRVDDHHGARDRGDGERWAVLPAAPRGAAAAAVAVVQGPHVLGGDVAGLRRRRRRARRRHDDVPADGDHAITSRTVDRYRELFRAAHGTEPKPPTFSEFLYCHSDAEEAEATARRYLSQYFLSVVKHYEFSGTALLPRPRATRPTTRALA